MKNINIEHFLKRKIRTKMAYLMFQYAATAKTLYDLSLKYLNNHNLK